MLDLNQVGDFLIFRDISAGDLATILSNGQSLEYDVGAVVLEEDEHGPDSDLFLILDGRVEVLIDFKQAATSRFGNYKQVAILNQGEVFGEIGLLNGRRRSAQIRAYAKLQLLKINRQMLFNQFERNPHLGYTFMRNLASVLSDRLVDLNFLWRNQT